MGKSYCFILVLLALGACSTMGDRPSISDGTSPVKYPSTVFNESQATMWLAAVRAMDIYSLTDANRDHGLLQTEWSVQKSNPDVFVFRKLNDGNDGSQWSERGPASTTGGWGENRSRLKLKMSPEKSDSTKTRVEVQKELLSYNRLNGKFEATSSDHSEELALLDNISWVLKTHVAKTCNGYQILLSPKDECPIEKKPEAAK